VTKILYFARFRQIVGRGSEELAVPASVKTVADLLDFLSERDGGCAAAFADRKIVKAAIDRKYAGFDSLIEGSSEIAFFPPVTGG
jgi:sulfur-carrier protein